MLLPFPIRVAKGHLFGKELFIRFTVTCLTWALVKFYVCLSFPFGIKGRMRDVIVLIPDHCLSIYFSTKHLQILIWMQFKVLIIYNCRACLIKVTFKWLQYSTAPKAIPAQHNFKNMHTYRTFVAYTRLRELNGLL